MKSFFIFFNKMNKIDYRSYLAKCGSGLDLPKDFFKKLAKGGNLHTIGKNQNETSGKIENVVRIEK